MAVGPVVSRGSFSRRGTTLPIRSSNSAADVAFLSSSNWKLSVQLASSLFEEDAPIGGATYPLHSERDVGHEQTEQKARAPLDSLLGRSFVRFGGDAEDVNNKMLQIIRCFNLFCSLACKLFHNYTVPRA